MFSGLLLAHCFWIELNKMWLEIQPKLLILKEQCQNTYFLAFLASNLACVHVTSLTLLKTTILAPFSLRISHLFLEIFLGQHVSNLHPVWSTNQHGVHWCLPAVCPRTTYLGAESQCAVYTGMGFILEYSRQAKLTLGSFCWINISIGYISHTLSLVDECHQIVSIFLSLYCTFTCQNQN